MNRSDRDLVRLALAVAADMDGRAAPATAGLLRRLAGRIVELAGDRRCAWCGGPIPEDMRTEARYCADRCRVAAWRARSRNAGA